jgi:hypothetical protein
MNPIRIIRLLPPSSSQQFPSGPTTSSPPDASEDSLDSTYENSTYGLKIKYPSTWSKSGPIWSEDLVIAMFQPPYQNLDPTVQHEGPLLALDSKKLEAKVVTLKEYAENVSMKAASGMPVKLLNHKLKEFL